MSGKNRTAKNRYDEKVKIDLPFKDALRGLLKTQPPDNGSAKPPKKPRQKKQAKS